MKEVAIIDKYRETDRGTDLLICIPNKHIGSKIRRQCCKMAEIRIDDGRHITADQRRKIYATIRDIAVWSGYLPEEMKELLKYLHIERTGAEYISLENCSVEAAGAFLDTIMEYALENGIALGAPGVDRAGDINRYLWLCMKYKSCAVCGQTGEIHHEDAIGMGNDRRKINDSSYRKICLCRKHHTIAHQKGMAAFKSMYHVYGIIFEGDDNEENQS